MTSFALKIIALISMFLDHFGYFLTHGAFSFMNYLGRLAFPIFAFQISEGYTHTHDIKKYMKRLFIFALISQLPFTLFCNSIGFTFELNIFFTLLLGLFCILLYDKARSKLLAFVTIGIICYAGELLKVDYGFWGILLIFLFYLFKNNKVLTTISFLLMCIYKFSIPMLETGYNIRYVILAISTFSAIIPILLYNGKLGYKTKYLLYIFYPAHLLLFYIASFI